MIMKKLLSVVLVLAMVSAASAVTVVSLVDIIEGDPGSASNPLQPSDQIFVEITTDEALITLDTLVSITGDGEIVGALGVADAADYGWNPAQSADPILTASSAEIGVGDLGLAGPGIVGYVLLQCNGPGDVVVSIEGATSFWVSEDKNHMPLDFSTATVTIYQIPEPGTIALFGLGGLALLRRRKQDKTNTPQ